MIAAMSGRMFITNIFLDGEHINLDIYEKVGAHTNTFHSLSKPLHSCACRELPTFPHRLEDGQLFISLPTKVIQLYYICSH